MKFKKLTACLDLGGCPNRCRHCWLGCTPNGHLIDDDLRFVAKTLRPFTDCLEVSSWYREPDYLPEYKELWELENNLSDEKTTHFELMSVWRAVRDEKYILWLKHLGVNTCQLTLFGGKEKTDYYTGRKGAYDEIIKAIGLLISNRIAPCVQVFINKDNVNDLNSIVDLIQDLCLEERCVEIGMPFFAFVHQGSCDGENAKLYDIRITPEDLMKIPPMLTDYTLKHFDKIKLIDVFGQTEQFLYDELINNNHMPSYISDKPVFFIDKDFNVYPNITAPSPYWCLGNLITEGAEKIIESYQSSKSTAQNVMLNISLGEMVRKCGDKNSLRLFTKGDYINYILNSYSHRT